MTLNAIFQVTICAKSAIIALSLLHGNHITIDQAVRLARIEEDFQTKYFGVVEGAHDLDEAYLYSVFSSARTILNLAQLRDI
jgi:chaperone required for assembly of F1-ATPase